MHENNAVVPKIPLSTDPLYGYLFLALEVIELYLYVIKPLLKMRHTYANFQVVYRPRLHVAHLNTHVNGANLVANCHITCVNT